MFKLEIDDKKYELNGDWTIGQWMELSKIDISLDMLWPKYLATATGAPIDICAIIPQETLQVGISLVGSLMQPNWASINKTLYGKHLIDYNKMSIGAFIDCETAIGRGIEKWLHLLVASLYEADMAEVIGWPFQKVWPAVHHYLNFRLELYKAYSSLFEVEEGESDDPGSAQDAAYIWYDMLMLLADEKFLNIEKASHRPLHEALNFLAWKKDMAKKEELELKRQRLK